MQRRLLKATAGIAITLIFFLAAEAATYLFGGQAAGFEDPMIAKDVDGWNMTREYHPLLFWRLRPSENLGSITTNSLGLRHPEVPAHKNDEFRILSLGESTTLGANVGDSETYSAQLQTSLKTLRGRSLRVINAGVPGYTIVQGYSFLKHWGLDLELDAVLLYFGYNDYLPRNFSRERDARLSRGTTTPDDWTLLAQRERPIARAFDGLMEHSNLFRVLARSLQPQLFATSKPSEEPRAATGVVAPVERRVPPEHRKVVLDEINALCKANGIELVVVVPWYAEFEGHAAILRDFAATSGVVIVDLPERLAQTDRPRREYFEDTVHPTAEGHALIAREIASVLESSLGR